MNDKDKKAFNDWWDDPYITNNEGCNISEYCKDSALDAWEYKQKEIDELQAENAKLRECVEFYAKFMNYSNLPEYGDGVFRTALFSDMEEINEFTKYGGKRARQVLKELDNNQLNDTK